MIEKLAAVALLIVSVSCRKAPNDAGMPAPSSSAPHAALPPIAMPRAGDPPEATIRAMVEAERRADKSSAVKLYRAADRELAETLDLVAPDFAAQPFAIVATRITGDTAEVDVKHGPAADMYPLALEGGIWKIDLVRFRELAFQSLAAYLADTGNSDADVQKMIGMVEAGVLSK
jgi:hypothetical protein